MAIEIVWDTECQYNRLWVTEPVVVTVLNRGSDWERVRKAVKVFSKPLNTTSGCPRFVSCVLGLAVVRYMGVEGGGMFATPGGTAIKLALRDGHGPTEMDDLAAQHHLYARQQHEVDTIAEGCNRALSLREVPVTDWNLSAFLGTKFGTMVQVSFYRDGSWDVLTESLELDAINAHVKMYLARHQ